MIIQENYKLAFDGAFVALSDETRVGFLPPGSSVFSKLSFRNRYYFRVHLRRFKIRWHFYLFIRGW